MARVLSTRSVAATLARRLAGGIRRGHHTRRPGTGVVLKIDAGGASTSTESASAVRRRLEEAIDGVMARMSEPEWAPFRPGTSYYAPPRPAGVAQALLELVTSGGGLPRALDDEARAVASASRGYPCSNYFIDGQFPDEVAGTRQDADPAEEE